jgi:hypothetical protein
MVADLHPALRQFYEEPDAASIALTPMSRLVVYVARRNQPKNPQGLTILAVLSPLRDMPFPRSVIASGALPSSPAKGLAEMPARPPSNRSADLSREE